MSTGLATKHLNTEDVESLAAHVLGTHVNNTFKAELGAYGGGGDTMLASTGFRDDTRLTQSTSKQDLVAHERVKFTSVG